MPANILIGLQWGDEGKGKVVDLLSSKVDAVVRFQGGANAGHTVHIGNEKIVLHLIPSGILRDKCSCVIGNGLVVDANTLIDEISSLKKNGYFKNEDRLFISHMAHLVMPYHKLLDALREKQMGPNSIGTTGRGIGPAYEDKITRRGIRAGELLNLNRFKKHLSDVLPAKNREIVSHGGQPIVIDDVMEEAKYWAQNISRYICDTVPLVQKWNDDGMQILLEGAQGTLLDIDHGTYPFVTSSNTSAGGACSGSGLGPRAIKNVIGIVKAYTTRVGNGPFPTEEHKECGTHLQEKGNEVGATTGRVRRCGWLDIPALKRVIAINSVNKLILTKLDVLTGLDEIEICVAYEMDGKRSMNLPVGEEGVARPVYETMKGWKEDISKASDDDDLPEGAKRYIARIEELLGTKISIVSVGKDREANIVREEVL